MKGQRAGPVDVLLVEFRKKTWKNEAGTRREWDKGHLSVGPEKILGKYDLSQILPCCLPNILTFLTLRICERIRIPGGFVKPSKSTRPYS